MWWVAGLRTAVELFYVASVAFGRWLLLFWRGAMLRTAVRSMFGRGTNLAHSGSRVWRSSFSGSSLLKPSQVALLYVFAGRAFKTSER